MSDRVPFEVPVIVSPGRLYVSLSMIRGKWSGTADLPELGPSARLAAGSLSPVGQHTRRCLEDGRGGRLNHMQRWSPLCR